MYEGCDKCNMRLVKHSDNEDGNPLKVARDTFTQTSSVPKKTGGGKMSSPRLEKIRKEALQWVENSYLN